MLQIGVLRIQQRSRLARISWEGMVFSKALVSCRTATCKFAFQDGIDNRPTPSLLFKGGTVLLIVIYHNCLPAWLLLGIAGYRKSWFSALRFLVYWVGHVLKAALCRFGETPIWATGPARVYPFQPLRLSADMKSSI